MKYSDKEIKMAYGIINDPRYKGGNMTAIVKKIEQIAKGLSKHPGVKKAIRATNESEFMKFVNQDDSPVIEASMGAAIEKAMRTALKDKGNYNKDGSVNWNFVDADCYMEVKPGQQNSKQFYKLFDQIADKLEKELGLNEGRKDAPKASKETTDDNPLITTYDDEFKKGRPGISGHMNLTTWMSIHAISKKYQKELAKQVLKGGVGKKVQVPDKIKADYDAEYKEEGLPTRNLWIELSQHHEKSMNEGVEYVVEGHMKNAAAKALFDYGTKNGGIDRKFFQDIAGNLENFMATGNKGVIANAAKTIKGMDTDPRDKALELILKNDKALGKAIMFKAGLK